MFGGAELMSVVDVAETDETGGGQVWSLTQLYSVDFSQSRISVKKCVFNKRIIKVWVSCFLTVLGPHRLARYILKCPCISFVLAAMGMVCQGPFKGAVSAQRFFKDWIRR